MPRLIASFLLALCATGALFAQLDTTIWRTFIQSGDLSKVSDAIAFVKEVHGRMDPQASNRGDARKIEDLIQSKSLAFTDSELIGSWKCRSVQGGNLGIYSYPFFPARITADKGRLLFDKTGGSQLRRGFLYADGPNQRRIFLGKQFVRGEDPKADYSGLLKDADGESTLGDSVGVLVKKATGKFVLILDATSTGYEVYELVR